MLLWFVGNGDERLTISDGNELFGVGRTGVVSGTGGIGHADLHGVAWLSRPSSSTVSSCNFVSGIID